MMENLVKVLAVADPAVNVYVKPEYSILNKFKATHGIDVEFDIIPFENYYEKLMKAFAGELDYDIVMVAGHLWLKDFVAKDYLAQLTEPSDKAYDEMDITEVVRDEMKIDGKKYLYPSFCDGHIVLYRKSMIEPVYGKINKKSITTDEYLDIARKYYKETSKPSVAMKAHESEIFLDILPFIRNEGIEPFDENTHMPQLDDIGCLNALNKYLELKSYAVSGTENFANDEVRKAFQNKEVPMTITWGGQLGMVMDENCIDKEDVGFLALNTSWNVTWSFGVSKASSRKDKAMRLLEYLTSKEVDRYVGSYAGSPVRKSTYEADKDNYPWYEIHYDLVTKYAKPLPKMLNAGKLMDPIYKGVYSVFTDKALPASALKEMHNQVMKLKMEESK